MEIVIQFLQVPLGSSILVLSLCLLDKGVKLDKGVGTSHSSDFLAVFLVEFLLQLFQVRKRKFLWIRLFTERQVANAKLYQVAFGCF